VVAVLTTSTTNYHNHVVTPDLPESLLQESDLLFRSGDEAISAAISTVSHGSWSHVGLLTRERGSWEVIHALPSGSEGKVGGVMMEPVSQFLLHSKAVAVFRTVYPNNNFQVTQRARLALKRPFGFAPSETYCTKFVMDVFAESSTPLRAKSSLFSILGQSFQIVLPQALAESFELRRIY
jgi:hypothetical protein